MSDFLSQRESKAAKDAEAKLEEARDVRPPTYEEIADREDTPTEGENQFVISPSQTVVENRFRAFELTKNFDEAEELLRWATDPLN